MPPPSRRRSAGGELRQRFGADRRRRHQLRCARPPTASSRRSAGTTTRPPPTSTGSRPARRSPSPTSPRSMTATAMSAPRTSVITITGTNDVPVIDAATNPGAITESAGGSSTQDIPTGHRHHHLHRPGPRRHPDAQRHRQCHRLLHGGALPVENSVNVSALIASRRHQLDALTTDGEQQTINWHLQPAAADLDWLAAGDTLTLDLRRHRSTTATACRRPEPGDHHHRHQRCAGDRRRHQPGRRMPRPRRTSRGHRHHHLHRRGPRRHPDAQRHRQCHRLLHGGALPAENSVSVSALVAAGAISFDPLTSDGEQQTINWHYNPAAADLDWLRPATHSRSPTSPRSMTATAMSAPRTW